MEGKNMNKGNETKQLTTPAELDVIKEYISGLTAKEIASMKYDTYNKLSTELMKAIMSKTGDTRASASEKARTFIKKTLHTQLVKITKDNELRNRMNYTIYRELEVEELF